MAIPGTTTFSRQRDEQGVSRALSAVLLGLLMVAAMLVASAAVATAEATAGVDSRVPGDDNPVGPTNWNNMTTKSGFVDYSSGGNVTVSNVRFLNGFDIKMKRLAEFL